MSVLRIATQASPSSMFPVLLSAKYVLLKDPEAGLVIQYDVGQLIQGTSYSIVWNGPNEDAHFDDDVLPAMKTAFLSLQHGGEQVRIPMCPGTCAY